MNKTQFCVSWDSYLNHVSKGFSYLQQNAEFVDMTLAADGHLVKVHQNIVALASPYIKTMLQSAPCQHPVIFLNNISHQILEYILEYIYTGEVKIPTDIIDKFIKDCKSLCIHGINSINAPKIPSTNLEPSVKSNEKPPGNNFAAHITINTNQANNYNVDLIANHNNSLVTNNEVEILPTPSGPTTTKNNKTVAFNTACGEILNGEALLNHNVDISSINNFVFIKPKNISCDNIQLNKNKTNPVKILNDVTIKAKNYQEIPSSSENNTSTIENPINIQIDNFEWPSNTSQNNTHLELNTNTIDNSVNNAVTTSDWQIKPVQNNSHMELNATENPVNFLINANWQSVLNQNNSTNELSAIPITLNANEWQTKLNEDTSNIDLNIENINLNTENWLNEPHQKSSRIELNAHPIGHPVNITCHTEDWPSQANENRSMIELNDNNMISPIKITLNAEDWISKNAQSNSNIELKSNPIEISVNNLVNNEDDQCESTEASSITLDKKQVHKHIKRIGSHMKLCTNQSGSSAKITLNKIDRIRLDKVPHYTISNRGSLQLLLNRFLYHSHHNSNGGRKKRWRCIDYRKMHCPAFIDTNNEDITLTSESHVHPNHDKQIRKKIKSNIVFTSYSNAVDTINNLLNDNNQAIKEPFEKMVQSQFSLSWDSYKSNICSGFSALQQNGEFVDMTIAADGHYVKVHQMLVALASPYLKELITSAPCQHPVIFLNNVSHRVLCLLLEYMYTGEAVVPADCLTSFAETAKSLHIRGLESIGNTSTLPVKMSTNVSMPNLDESESSHVTATKHRIVSATEKLLDEVSLPVNATKIFIKHGPSMTNPPVSNVPATIDNIHEYPELMDDSNTQDSDDGFKMDENTNKDNNASHDKPSSKLQFTVSIRGSLQVILNRYIYNLHSTTQSGLRRWRCVDYRNNKCAAYVTTKGNVVLNRANLHNHAFHDRKILSKIEKKAIYSAIEEVESYKEKENSSKNTDETDISMDNDGFITLEEFGGNLNIKSSTPMEVKDT